MLTDHELMAMRVQALFTHDAHSRLLLVNEPGGGAPAPRLFLGRTRAGNLWRFRADLPETLLEELEARCVADPVRAGFIASLARPSGNITGVSDLVADLSPKRLELLKEAGPGISRVAVLADPANPYTPAMVSETEQAARALGVQLHILEITDPSSLEPAFVTITTERADALVVLPAARFGTHARRITDLVAQYHLPAIYPSRGFVEVGGLMSYGTNNTELLRRAATYVDKILKGTKPADLPVEQPMRFEFVINLKTAQALGFPIPPSILFQADEVIK